MSEYMVIALVWLYQLLGNNLALAITVFTLSVRFILLPLSLPMIKTQEKIKKLQPELSLLKKQHKDDAQSYQKAQLELYSKHNVNPLGGCIPQIAQIGFFFLLYQAMQQFIGSTELYGVKISTTVFGVDLAQPDSSYILVVLMVLIQLVFSVMIAPGAETPDVVPNDSKDKKVQKENEKEEDTAQMAKTMQMYMLYMMPLMMGFAALSFPAGLTIYMLVNTIFSLGQQFAVSGAGGLTVYYKRLINLVRS